MPLSVMDRYKNEFAISFARAMEKNLSRWKKFQNFYRKQLITADLKWYALAFAFGLTPGKHERHYLENINIHIIVGIILMILAIIICIHTENKNYQNEVKSTFYKNLLKIFGQDIHYAPKEGSYTLNEKIKKLEDGTISPEEIEKEYEEEKKVKNITNSTFKNSELFGNHNIANREDDDVFWGTYHDVEFRIAETDFGWYEKDKKNNKKTYHPLFAGLAMQFTMNKMINCRVLIYSKSLINIIPAGYEKIELEYEKFNKKYNVYAPIGATGQIEARYLFNTAFLDRFMQIQTSFKVDKVKCSIKNNIMLIMLETGSDLFEMNHLFGRIDDKHQYAKLFDEFASVLSFIDVLHLFDTTKL